MDRVGAGKKKSRAGGGKKKTGSATLLITTATLSESCYDVPLLGAALVAGVFVDLTDI